MDLVIPLGIGYTAQITALNAAIPAWVQSQSTSNSPISIADCNTGFPTSDLRDGIHPNAAGDAIIASRIYPVLLGVINSALGGSKPTGTTSTGSGSTPTSTTSSVTPVSSGSPLYGQCGGEGWTGPTTCASGTCTYSNPWYSQCLP